MKRILIFRLSPKEKIKADLLGRRLLGHPYSDESGQGFLVDEIDEGRLTARFFYRTKTIFHSLDPNGNLFPQEVVKFLNYKFEVNDATATMSVTDPPASLKIFFGKLCEALGSPFSIEILRLPLHKIFVSDETDISFHKLVVRDFQFRSSLTISGDVTGKLSRLNELVSGISNVNIIAIEGRLNGVIKPIKSVRCRITATGSISFSQSFEGNIERLRDYLSGASE